jgi:glucose/arabinose dehydrogenase
MKSSFRLGIGLLFGAALVAHGQRLSNTTWTNVPAFPGLPGFASRPVVITSPPGETNRLFICEHAGVIAVITNLAAPNRSVFMNMTSRVTESGESGLCGMAFHPGYATNGFFYAFFTGTTNGGLCEYVSRFHVSATNINQGDMSSEVVLMGQPDRVDNHNAGDMHFGPDGYLYIAVGDEGDQYNVYHNAQHINSNLFSGILRIDVDKRPGSLAPNPSANALITANYAIPPDNPFVGATSFDGIAINPAQVRTEFWAVGMRNPWRFSFDPVTGLLYSGDVGQDTVEEINIVKKGGNYGWATWEGNLSPPPGVNTNGQPIAQNPIGPIIQYVHGTAINQGHSVIGGLVYRGSRFPQLTGAYVYGEFSYAKVWASFYDGTNATTPFLMFTNSRAMAFGTDPRNGDVLYGEETSLLIKRIIALSPAITGVDLRSTNIVISGAGGLPGSNYFVLTSTNFANWVYTFTGRLDDLGNFNVTNSVPPNATRKFYRISR